MTSSKRPSAIVKELEELLEDRALPGELDGFDDEQRVAAAQFVAEVAGTRKPGKLSMKLQSTGGSVGHRRMRLAMVNDDMPFLVDSVAAAINATGLTIHRLLHPTVCVTRDEKGNLEKIGKGDLAESMIYFELDRADARTRQDLVASLQGVLDDVRAAVTDWKAMLAELRADADALAAKDKESSDFLTWLAKNNFTLLGQAIVDGQGKMVEGRGILAEGLRLWDDDRAIEKMLGVAKTRPMLITKADMISPVHRRVPLDVLTLMRDDGTMSIHAGLWTSAALRAPAEDVPILRKILVELDEELGFAPSSHGAKALAHAISTLPHDLIIAVSPDAVRQAATTAMSLADRPRPALMLIPGALGRHVYGFVWLPREELTTSRRLAIADMLSQSMGKPVTSWSVELGDGELALLRFTLRAHGALTVPNVAKLDERLNEMVRGFAPRVEEALVERVGSGRATRLGIAYLPALPEQYRSVNRAEDAAEDIIRLSMLDGDERAARLYKSVKDEGGELHLNTYRKTGLIPLSEAVPVLENFGFRVIDEMPTELRNCLGFIHDFQLELPSAEAADDAIARADTVEKALAEVFSGEAENDAFNQLILYADLDPQAVIWLRSWFRYLRQTGVTYGLVTMVEALRRCPAATKALIDLFVARHDPALKGDRDKLAAGHARKFDSALNAVKAIDDDRILRLMRAVVDATLRTNAFDIGPGEALAYKIDSAKVPGLPAPIPYREIWVYSPRVEGIHLRGGPIARGGLRWSDRRDDFRTEILGLMKAQLVKNAVIVPTGAKGGFYAKQLPNPADNRDAWYAEGTEAYRIFIRSLLSVTDNILNDKVVHPKKVVIHDGEDPYFVVAADKGTAAFSDVANAIALERNFWLGDAFASGGSNGYDHKAMGITAKGAWISVQRHFLEMGIDVQSEPVTVVGVGDMSGDVFGNGMLLSKAIKLVAAFDHRHIFIDPDPDPKKSWAERQRMFELPRSSWDDYDRKAMSKGGMIVSRGEKQISLTPEAQAALGLEDAKTDPASLMSAIMKAPVGLIWFGGIGTYIKASHQTHSQVGDPGNDTIRVDARDVRAKVIGEGANLAINQAGRIEFAMNGGRINTDFIDNSAGVDCSDNEVNIKIPLNRKMREGDLEESERNKLLVKMTDDVSELVLEDNRLQSLALSIAESMGADGLPGFARTIEMLEASGRLDRKVEGLESSAALLRRGNDGMGLTRPELAVVLSMSKLELQDAAEELQLADDPTMEQDLFAAFPPAMQKKHADAIRNHRLRHEIIATKVANRIVNRLGPSMALDLIEEEGVPLPQIVAAFLVAERLLNLDALWEKLEAAEVSEVSRIRLFATAAQYVRQHLGDIIRAAAGETDIQTIVETLEPGKKAIARRAGSLIRGEVKSESAKRRDALIELGATDEIADKLTRIYELDGIFGLAALAARKKMDEVAVTRAYTQLGEELGLDWAQQQVARFKPVDQWERLLVAGLARDFEQLRIDFLDRARGDDPGEAVAKWIAKNPRRIETFRALIERAKRSGSVSSAMLAQVVTQARVLLGR